MLRKLYESVALRTRYPITLLICGYYNIIAIVKFRFTKKSQLMTINKTAGVICKHIGNANLIVLGEENMVDGQPYVFAPTHQSFYDCFLIYHLNKNRPMIAVAKLSLSRIPLASTLFRMYQFVLIDRSNQSNAIRSLLKGLRTVDSSSSLLIFPEGTRTRDGSLGRINPGIGLIAKKLDKPIMPVIFAGTKDLMPRGGKIYGNKLVVTKFCEPISVRDKSTDEIVSAVAHSLRVNHAAVMSEYFPEVPVDVVGTISSADVASPKTK